MTQEDFKIEIERIYNETYKLSQDKIKLKDDFILKNAKFELGEKVKVVTPESKNFERINPEKIEFGFIGERYVNDRGEIKYEVYKIKKDGTQSSHKLWVWYNNIIEKF